MSLLCRGCSMPRDSEYCFDQACGFSVARPGDRSNTLIRVAYHRWFLIAVAEFPVISARWVSDLVWPWLTAPTYTRDNGARRTTRIAEGCRNVAPDSHTRAARSCATRRAAS